MTSRLEIDKGALANNLAFLRGMVSEQTKISSVVKGNAYGHGISTYVPLAESLGVDHFSVFSADEAREVYEVLSKKESEIMIMGYLDDHDLKWAIEIGISFYVFDFDRLQQSISYAKETGKKAKINVEIETGMNRTGFERREVEEVIKVLKNNSSHVEFYGLCTHFAGAEAVQNLPRVHDQKELYNQLAAEFRSNGIVFGKYHSCCSAATIRLPEMQGDLVRIGILQFGFWPSREVFIEFISQKGITQDPLQRIISWKSQVMNTKIVKPGDYIGYGTTFLAQKEMKIAIVPVGYSHGFSRSLGNLGRAILRGTRVPVLGMVNMNCTAIDISDLEDCKKGDEVILIGKSGDAEISVSSFSELSDQLNYELLTRLPAKIPRLIV